MSHSCRMELDGQSFELPVVVGTENELGIDISKLRSDTGYITADSGYGNTGSCQSAITYIDGDQGILRYRGYAIEDLAENSSFIESAWLVIFGELPTQAQHDHFSQLLSDNSLLHESMSQHFAAFPSDAHPMGVLSAMINVLGAHEKGLIKIEGDEQVELAAAVLMSKARTMAAAAYKASVGEPMQYPKPELDYVENFLHLMFSKPNAEHQPVPSVAKALNLFLLLHADHEQNCSTSTVRMVASSQSNMFASCSAGVGALWGPLHGGANVAVIEMLEEIRDSGTPVQEYVNQVKDKSSKTKLMGFGHRVYRNFDPRAKILKQAADDMLKELNVDDPLLDIAQELADAALNDEYFIERKLYPNVDFYSGIILRAMGIPLNMFTVMFALGRMPGWIANWKEVNDDPKGRIYRPRQIYVGETERSWEPADRR